jgi:deoxyribonuclease V
LEPVLEHPWDLSEKDAQILQERLACRVIISDEMPRRLQLVAGVDVAYGEDKKLAFAAAVVLDWKTLRVKESVSAEGAIRFPYVPGLLSFREIPAIESALKRLVAVPDTACL